MGKSPEGCLQSAGFLTQSKAFGPVASGDRLTRALSTPCAALRRLCLLVLQARRAWPNCEMGQYYSSRQEHRRHLVCVMMLTGP